MNPFKSSKLPTASPAHKELHVLDCSHKSTFEIGDLHPTYYRKLIEGDVIDIDMSQQVLTAPMKVPPFGALSFKHRAFWCPFRLIMKYFEDFLANNRILLKDGSYGVPVKPFFKFTDFVTALFFDYDTDDYLWDLVSDTSHNYSNDYFELINSGTSVTIKDINDDSFTFHGAVFDTSDYQGFYNYILVAIAYGIQGENEGFVYYMMKPTFKGRQVLKIFESLGYKIPFIYQEAYNDFDTFHRDSNLHDRDVEALTLLSFSMLHKEFFAPSIYSNRLFINRLLQKFESAPTTSDQLRLSGEIIKNLLDDIALTYEEDYFTQAWQTPSNVLADGENVADSMSPLPYGVTLQELQYYSQQFDADLSSTVGVDANPFYSPSDQFAVDDGSLGSNIPSNAWYSVDIHNLAQKLKDFIKRKILSGNRADDVIKAETGIDVVDKSINHPIYLGTCEIPIVVQQITNTSSSEGAVLGQYGATAKSDGNHHFHYEAKERGIFMIVTSLLPRLEIVQGMNRDHFDLSYIHEFHSDFEGKFMQPVLSIEKIANPQVKDNVYHDPLSGDEIINGNLQPFDIYGFQQGYAHMKAPQNFMSGDFCRGANGVARDLACYHLGYVAPLNDDTLQPGVNIAQRNLLYVDGLQYDRIFNVTDNSVDHFFGTFWFHVKLRSLMKSVSNCWDVQGQGEVNTTTANGSRMS